MKMKLTINTEKLNEQIESAIDNFKDMEANVLHDVDLKKCVDDYIAVIFICHDHLFELKESPN